LAPIKGGGRTSTIDINGKSLEPQFSGGALRRRITVRCNRLLGDMRNLARTSPSSMRRLPDEDGTRSDDKGIRSDFWRTLDIERHLVWPRLLQHRKQDRTNYRQ
jgi:hypothetical protein